MNNTTKFNASELTQLGLSAQAVAKLLGVSTRHIWALHSSGRLPKPFKLGRATRWDRRELERWMAAGAPPRDQWDRVKDGVR